MGDNKIIGRDGDKLEGLLEDLQAEWIKSFTGWVKQIISETRCDLEDQPNGLLGKWELKLRDGLRPLQEQMLRGIISLVGNGYQGSFQPCSCGGQLHYKRRVKAKVYTLVGEIELERAYYYDKHCGKSICFLDKWLGIEESKWSPGMRRVLALLGSEVPFDRASELVWETSGLVVSDNSVQRVSERVGKELNLYEAKERTKRYLDGGQSDTQKRLYMEVDGGRVPLRRGVA